MVCLFRVVKLFSDFKNMVKICFITLFWTPFVKGVDLIGMLHPFCVIVASFFIDFFMI